MSGGASKGSLGGAGRYLRVAGQYARIGVIRKSQFRVEFFTQVLMDCCWYLSHVLTFEILFLHTEQIAGWTVPEIRVFLGYLFVADAFLMAWLGQGWHFGRDLKDGKLDPVRVRPMEPAFLYFFQRFSLEGAVNMLIALGYLVFAVASGPVGFTPKSTLLFLWGIALAWQGRWLLTVLLSTVEFYVLHSNLSNFGYELQSAAADNPLDIWGRRTRALLLYAAPLGALAHVPASMALQRVGWGFALGYTAWLAALGWLVLRLWQRGFRRYESALG